MNEGPWIMDSQGIVRHWLGRGEKVSAMRDMSRAIRHELSEFGPTLQSLPDQELSEFTEILGAFFYDLVGEQDRRGWGSARPAATVARTLKSLQARLDAHHVGVESCILCEGVDASLDADPGGTGGMDGDVAPVRPARGEDPA